MNLLIIILILLGLCISLYFFFTSKKYHRETDEKEDPQRYTIPSLIEYVKDSINEITRTNLYELGLNEVEFKKQTNKRAELKKALKVCMHGSLEDKQFIKAFIYDILLAYIPDEKINSVIPFNNPYLLSTKEKFAILLHMLKKEHGYKALSYLIDTFELDKLKKSEDGEESYYVSKEEINDIYDRTGVIPSREDKLEIITQAVYERYKGLGVIDEIRDMNIDGVSAGVSGVTSDFTEFPRFQDKLIKSTRYQKNYESVWIFYKGKSIKFEFLGFETESELKRVCQIIYRYNRGGQLSESTGYRVNEMKDGSRILVVRPPFSESWAFFVRKFYIKNVNLNMLIRDENAHLPINLIKYIVKGGMITSITGQQGSGKTTMLMAMIEHIYATLTLRIQEMAFELNLRKLYPGRNILSFRETETISGQMGLDIQKKTDGSVNILGEVATDPVAAWMIQMSQVASLFTLFTHHAKTTRDLVYSLRNSLLKCEMFSNEKIAEQQVVSVLDFDIHLARDYEGKRYIERITEIVEIPDLPLPQNYIDKKDLKEKSASFMDTTAEYYKKMTDRRIFECRNIIEFKDGKYIAVNPVTPQRANKMKSAMTKKDAQEFELFVAKYLCFPKEVSI
ncbi:MAG: Flp pilus assembly complex ATPase component TadA [Clostridiaceae bacterium]|nr:Flp pilus assembly complex ATPase component TadA [Clostridiaceae bacterium]